MKSYKIALLLALLLPLGNNALANSRPHSSYKSGFSSQKSSPSSSSSKPKSGFGSFGARPAATPAPSATPKSGFGSFGGARAGDPAAPAKSGSALSKDLEQSGANANALKTLDARRAAAAAASAPPVQPSYNPQNQPSQNNQQYSQPQPIIVQQQSNGLGNAMLGFMLGRAMSGDSHRGGYYPSNGVQNGGQVGGQNGAMAAGTAEPKSSFGMTMLRTFAWLLLLGVLGWLIYFCVKLFRRGKARSAANYSFERQ
ncbi:MAG TPA: hypothetical protein DCW29_05660 [Janthinobacterium sp.]|nr:hypothetical protein [Janthinobacterium sp.]